MDLRFVTKTVHAYLDYPVALSLIGLPFFFGFGKTNPWELWLSVGTGIAAFTLTLFTDHRTGVVRVIPYWLHLMVDRVVGFVFLIAPHCMGFTGKVAWYYWLNAAAVLLVTTVLSAPEPDLAVPAPVGA